MAKPTVTNTFVFSTVTRSTQWLINITISNLDPCRFIVVGVIDVQIEFGLQSVSDRAFLPQDHLVILTEIDRPTVEFEGKIGTAVDGGIVVVDADVVRGRYGVGENKAEGVAADGGCGDAGKVRLISYGITR